MSRAVKNTPTASVSRMMVDERTADVFMPVSLARARAIATLSTRARPSRHANATSRHARCHRASARSLWRLAERGCFRRHAERALRRRPSHRSVSVRYDISKVAALAAIVAALAHRRHTRKRSRPARPRSKLHLEEVGSDSTSFDVVATLIVGPTEVLLWDTQYHVADARRLADRIAATQQASQGDRAVASRPRSFRRRGRDRRAISGNAGVHDAHGARRVQEDGARGTSAARSRAGPRCWRTASSRRSRCRPITSPSTAKRSR